MSEFYKTPMGRTFYESTVPRIAKVLGELPRIAKALENINENLRFLIEMLVVVKEDSDG